MSHEVYKRKLRAGIVGGGSGAFIGAVHRIAAELDGQADIQACALSSDPVRAMESAIIGPLNIVCAIAKGSPPSLRSGVYS